MKKKILGFFVSSLLVVAMFTMLFSVVFAKKHGIAVSGLFYRTGNLPDVNRVLPHGRHSAGAPFHMFTGDFYGPAEGQIVNNIHYQGGPPGGAVSETASLSGRNFETITVLKFLDESATGTITMLWSLSNKQWRIISGTGDFEHVHGSGTWDPDPSYPVQPAHRYSGIIYFNP